MNDASNYDEFEGFEDYEYIPEEEDYDQLEIDLANRALTELGKFNGQRNSRNERHGFGKTTLPNGDTYVGTYKNDQRHGYGVYKFKNGAKYRGCYKNNLRNGQGVMHYPDRSRYEGRWVDNKKDGDGTFTYANKDEYSGSWKNDVKHGVGMYSFCKSKAVLKGKWSNGKKDSNFQFYFPTGPSSGFTFHGTWDENENVAGLGYFVFEDSMCMQRGIHVNNNNYNSLSDNNASSIEARSKPGSMWYSNKILPIITSMLPELPKKKQSLNQNQSSCEMITKITDSSAISRMSTTSSRVEMYERTEDLWAEVDEFEVGEGATVVNENDVIV